jgi:DNA-directed RNA polymerase specialized sigma24 family protein
MVTSKELPPPVVGELVGLRDAALVTEDSTELRRRVFQLHHDGASSAELGEILGVSAKTIRTTTRAGGAG